MPDAFPQIERCALRQQAQQPPVGELPNAGLDLTHVLWQAWNPEGQSGPGMWLISIKEAYVYPEWLS